ncbi:hypothetical protein ANN_13452 [Periplaneta americana]|uniref:Uncharacterized protein n=1 Tax=Periplaneta americana TaxID=6978 RepID=A0ABQ8TJL3_PERAM|nr:hypothetical protein ANN_13452 [Periplaneta americana]
MGIHGDTVGSKNWLEKPWTTENQMGGRLQDALRRTVDQNRTPKNTVEGRSQPTLSGSNNQCKEEQKLRMFENKVLRKILGAKRDEVTGNGESYTTQNCTHSILHLTSLVSGGGGVAATGTGAVLVVLAAKEAVAAAVVVVVAVAVVEAAEALTASVVVMVVAVAVVVRDARVHEAPKHTSRLVT